MYNLTSLLQWVILKVQEDKVIILIMQCYHYPISNYFK